MGVFSPFLSFTVSLSAYLWNRASKLHQISVQITSACSSVLLWWHCSTLCTSGFVDDVIFFHNESYGIGNASRPSVSLKWLTRGSSRPGVESDIYSCRVVISDGEVAEESTQLHVHSLSDDAQHCFQSLHQHQGLWTGLPFFFMRIYLPLLVVQMCVCQCQFEQ